MGRPPCCDKSNVKRGPWTPEEDAKILAYVASHGIGNWTLVPQKAGLNRCGKSCRLRWTNYLRPDLKHDNFTPQEEECILECHKAFGSRWSLIAKRLPGRTDNDVKNYWNTKLKKKLAKMGIDPVTHKPFSQVFTEYGKISCLPIAKDRNPFLQNVTLNDQTILKPENNGRLETLAQFQAISNQEMVSSCYSSDSSFSSAFSSPNGVTRFCLGPSHTCEPPQAQMVPSSLFGHGEYVVSGDDQFPGCKYSGQLSLFDNATIPIDKIVTGEKCRSYCEGDKVINGNCGGILGNAINGASSSSSSSSAADTFVEAILAHDSEMRLQFLNILDEDYGY